MGPPHTHHNFTSDKLAQLPIASSLALVLVLSFPLLPMKKASKSETEPPTIRYADTTTSFFRRIGPPHHICPAHLRHQTPPSQQNVTTPPMAYAGSGNSCLRAPPRHLVCYARFLHHMWLIRILWRQFDCREELASVQSALIGVLIMTSLCGVFLGIYINHICFTDWSLLSTTQRREVRHRHRRARRL
jgi:hypothetical protein